MPYYHHLIIKMHSLIVFRNLLSDSIVRALLNLISLKDKSTLENVDNYGTFMSLLLTEDINLSKYLLNQVLQDENIYMIKWASDKPGNDALDDCLVEELKIIRVLSQITAKEILSIIRYDGYLPSWQNTDYDFVEAYRQRLKELPRYGYGVFAKHKAFQLQNEELTPILNPDPIRLNQLKSYDLERAKVIRNTESLLNNHPAANVLLYGDAGTGKSSTVKGIFNEFKDQGLRLIEVSKKNIPAIPRLLDKLVAQPLKFIIFIDDLALTKEQDDYGTLKAILEGSVSAKSPNVVIYATSNRRHLLKENWTDREGDDIHRNETIQEEISLSDRFGLAIFFNKPDKTQYLEIIFSMAKENGLQFPEDVIELEAERFALNHSGRSPRIARQFIDEMLIRAGDSKVSFKDI